MTIRGNVRTMLCGITATLIVAWASGQDAKADGIITADPSLPPVGTIGGEAAYLTPADVHAMYSGPGLDVVLSMVQHRGFTNIKRDTVGQDEIETFQSTLSGLASVNGTSNAPFSLSGQVMVESFGKAGMVTGTFDTEMLSMNLTGTVLGMPVEIRVSPTLASTGQTSITDIGGGLYQIHSFFDVFTETQHRRRPDVDSVNCRCACGLADDSRAGHLDHVSHGRADRARLRPVGPSSNLSAGTATAPVEPIDGRDVWGDRRARRASRIRVRM